MCAYGLWAQPSGGCSPIIVGRCETCGMETCEACYLIGQDNYEDKCPCSKGKFKLD